jgi:hypothetical protein
MAKMAQIPINPRKYGMCGEELKLPADTQTWSQSVYAGIGIRSTSIREMLKEDTHTNRALWTDIMAHA